MKTMRREMTTGMTMRKTMMIREMMMMTKMAMSTEERIRMLII